MLEMFLGLVQAADTSLVRFQLSIGWFSTFMISGDFDGEILTALVCFDHRNCATLNQTSSKSGEGKRG